MTLGELIGKMSNTQKIEVTCLAYFSDTKEYYSFRPIVNRHYGDAQVYKIPKHEYDKEVKSIFVTSDGYLCVDVVELIGNERSDEEKKTERYKKRFNKKRA